MGSCRSGPKESRLVLYSNRRGLEKEHNPFSVEIAAFFYLLYVMEKLPVQIGTLGLIIVAAG